MTTVMTTMKKWQDESLTMMHVSSTIVQFNGKPRGRRRSAPSSRTGFLDQCHVDGASTS